MSNFCKKITNAELEASLLKMNDDCIEHIMKFMSLTAQLRWGNGDERLEDIMRMVNKSRIQKLLVLYGEYKFIHNEVQCAYNEMRRIVTQVSEEYLFPSMSPGIKMITVCCPDFKVEQLSTLTNLEELRIKKCDSSSSSYRMQSIFSTFRNLKVFEVRYVEGFTNVVLRCVVAQCTQIEHFEVHTRNYLDLTCAAKLPQLKSVEVCADRRIVHAFMLALVQHCADQLEFLTVRSTNSINFKVIKVIAGLKNLKGLSFPMVPTEAVLSDYALNLISNLKHLEFLRLPSFRYVRKTSVLHLINECRALKYLDLISNFKLPSDFALDIVELVKNFKTITDDPLIVNFDMGFRLNETVHPMVENFEFINNNQYVKLVHVFSYDDGYNETFPARAFEYIPRQYFRDNLMQVNWE